MRKNINTIDLWLNKIRTAMKEVYTNGTISFYEEIMDEKYSSELMREFDDNKFAIVSLQKYISKCKNKSIYELDGIKITTICDRIKSELHKQIVMSLFRIKTICALFGIHLTLNIVLIPLNKPRTKPNNNEPVLAKHVNGGYTYIHNGTIYIYRVEEWPKVILHEILHNIPKIQNIHWSIKQIEQLYKEFTIDPKGCPNYCTTVLEPTEAVVETWAIFLHTAFIAIEDEGRKNFYVLLEKELEWNNKQARWILEKQKMSKDGVWKEETHTFSYIVIRAILLHNLEHLLKMRIPYSSNAIVKLILQEWEKTRKNIMNSPYEKNGAFRMSKFGNM